MKILAIPASLLALAATPCLAAGDAGATPAAEGAQKMVLKISTIETAGTRTQKTWNPPSTPIQLTELPHTEEDIAKASPLDAREMVRENREQRISNQYIQAQVAMKAFADATRHYQGVKQQLEGTTFGRQVILAVDKFAGYAGKYFDGDCIELFHRMDADESAKEQALQDVDADMIASPNFLKFIFDDPRVESSTVEMNGQQFKRTKATVSLTWQIQNLAGKMVAADVVKIEKSLKSTNAVARKGADDALLVEAIEEALQKTAADINRRFVAKATIKLIGPKGDGEFDPEAATVQIDGVDQDAGEEFSVLKGRHAITVELEGYVQAKSPLVTVKKDGVIKIVLKKAPAAPAVDADGE